MTRPLLSSDAEPLLPVTVISGFLGSGKSTAINALLRGDHGLKLAVIVNEFGAVGIDGSMLTGDAEFVELDNGCLCCALNDELEATAKRLVARGGFDRIIIETTGLADPLPVAWTFCRGPLKDVTRIDAIVTFVDAIQGMASIQSHDEAREQVLRADVVIINKMDAVADGGKAALAVIHKLRPDVTVLYASFGQLPASLLLDGPSEITRAGEKPSASHGHIASMQTLSLQRSLQDPVDPVALADFLEALGSQVFRVKGIVRTCDDVGEFTLVNGVAGRTDIRPLEPRRAPVASTLVFIDRVLDAPALLKMCEAHMGPWAIV